MFLFSLLTLLFHNILFKKNCTSLWESQQKWDRMNERKPVAISVFSPSTLSEVTPKMSALWLRYRGRKGEMRECRKRFLSLKLPPLLLQTPNVQCCAHPGGVILDAPQEYCSSPLRHRLWFSTVNKHDVVLTVIAQTGMFLFYFSFSYLHIVSRVCMRCWERRRKCGTAWFISDSCCFNYLSRGHRQILFGQV